MPQESSLAVSWGRLYQSRGLEYLETTGPLPESQDWLARRLDGAPGHPSPSPLKPEWWFLKEGAVDSPNNGAQKMPGSWEHK